MLKKLSLVFVSTACLSGGSAIAAGHGVDAGIASGMGNDPALQMAIDAAKNMLKGGQATPVPVQEPSAKTKSNMDKTLILGSPESVPM